MRWERGGGAGALSTRIDWLLSLSDKPPDPTELGLLTCPNQNELQAFRRWVPRRASAKLELPGVFDAVRQELLGTTPPALAPEAFLSPSHEN